MRGDLYREMQGDFFVGVHVCVPLLVMLPTNDQFTHLSRDDGVGGREIEIDVLVDCGSRYRTGLSALPHFTIQSAIGNDIFTIDKHVAASH